MYLYYLNSLNGELEMPIYEFICDSCQNQFEKLRKIIERKDSVECPICNSLAHRNPNPTSISVITRSLSSSKSLSVENDPIDTSGGVGFVLPQGGEAYIKDCYVRGIKTGFVANGTKVRGENIHFEDTKTGIQHTNSDIELKNVTYKNTSKGS